MSEMTASQESVMTASPLPTANDFRENVSIPKIQSTGRRRYGELTQLSGCFLKAMAPKGQMLPIQTVRILIDIMKRAPSNVLVFGGGPNAELYHLVNQWGITLVLDVHRKALAKLGDIGCGICRVQYSTRIADGVVENCPKLTLPEWVRKTSWQVVVVDGPLGEKPESPGRQQSMATAAELVDPKNGVVFVHDVERPHHQACAAKHLPEPSELIGKRPQLAIIPFRQ